MTTITIPSEVINIPSDPAIAAETLRAQGVEGSLSARITALENAVPPVTPPVVPPATGKSANITTNSYANLAAILSDQTLDSAVFTSSLTFSGSYGDMNIVRTKPIVVTCAPGVLVTFDGGGASSWALPGWDGGHATNIIFRGLAPDGTHQFRLQNFNVGQAGVILTGYAEDCEFSGFIARNVTGASGQQTSHFVYCSTAVLPGGGTVQGTLHGARLTFNDWDVQGDTNRNMNGLQNYHAPQVAGITAKNWIVDRVHWGYVGRYNVTNALFDDWKISNADIPFDASGPTGIVRNMTATASGKPILGAMTDGGGNSW